MTDTFKAVTWNVYHGTSRHVLAPILSAQRGRGVSLFLMQEAGGHDLTDMLIDQGLRTFCTGQWRVAWNPDRWVRLAAARVRLSDQPWFAKDGETPIYSDAAQVLLCDRVGRSLTALSYHTPAHVQVPQAERPDRRYDAMLDTFRTLGTMAADAYTRGWLAGGDDNWDESRGIQVPEARAVLLGRDDTTGLHQVAAPQGTATHGPVRRIDDFRVPRGGALAVGAGWVAPGGGDHRLHGREFAWR